MTQTWLWTSPATVFPPPPWASTVKTTSSASIETTTQSAQDPLNTTVSAPQGGVVAMAPVLKVVVVFVVID